MFVFNINIKLIYLFLICVCVFFPYDPHGGIEELHSR